MSLGSQNDITKTWLNFENSSNLLHSCSRVYRKSRLAYIPNLQIFSFANFHPCLAEESEKRETRSKRREGGIGRIKEESLIASRGKKMISSKNSPRTVVSSRVHACACVSRHDRTWSGNAASRASKTRCVALLWYKTRVACINHKTTVSSGRLTRPREHLSECMMPHSQSQRVISFLLSRRSCVFLFNDSEIDRVCEFLIFFSSTLTRRFLRIATRISYFVRWIKARQSNWILYYTEQSWKSLWNEISCRFDGIIKIIRNFSFFFF